MSRFVFAAALVCATPALAETSYFAQIDDLPIASGLQETAEHFEFSDAGVRVVGASARGQANAEQARAFYQAALPALGWALSVGAGGENETVYLRGREELALTFFQRGEILEVQVRLFSSVAPHD